MSEKGEQSRTESKRSLSRTSSVAQPSQESEPTHLGHGESAIPEDKHEEKIEILEDDWENDPENARNWPNGRRWTAMCIVRF